MRHEKIIVGMFHVQLSSRKEFECEQNLGVRGPQHVLTDPWCDSQHESIECSDETSKEKQIHADSAGSSAGAELAAYGSDAQPCVVRAHKSGAKPDARPEQSLQPTGAMLSCTSIAILEHASPVHYSHVHMYSQVQWNLDASP